MNCKIGELVHFIGIISPKISPFCYGWVGKTVRYFDVGDGIEWEVDPPIPTINEDIPWIHVFDISLRPIRDNDGEDEMLRIAGKPANYKGKVVSAKPMKLEKL